MGLSEDLEKLTGPLMEYEKFQHEYFKSKAKALGIANRELYRAIPSELHPITIKPDFQPITEYPFIEPKL